MKPVLFGASLLVAVAASTAATAEVVKVAGAVYASPAEALANAPAPPAACLDAAGASRCIVLYLPQYNRDPRGWQLAWATADTPFECVDMRASSSVDCEAPNAVATQMASKIAAVGDAYLSPEEAFLNASMPPAACLHPSSGGNTCISSVIPVGQGDGDVAWQFIWATADSSFRCIERSTHQVVDCDAPNAVRSLVPPRIPRVPAIALSPASK